MMRSERVYRGSSIEMNQIPEFHLVHPVGMKYPLRDVLGKVL